MLAVCEGYRGVVVYLKLSLWKFTDASRDVLASATTTTDQVEISWDDSRSIHRRIECQLRYSTKTENMVTIQKRVIARDNIWFNGTIHGNAQQRCAKANANHQQSGNPRA
jgi:hypothetical protein